MGLFDANKIIDAKKYSGNAKATIQMNGRLGFSSDATKLMSLESDQKIVFAEVGDGDLAGIVTEPGEDSGFKVQKGGDYHYLRMKGFFDSHGVEYKDKRVIFDISETDEMYGDKRVYKFTRREIDKKDKSDQENLD